MKKSIVFLFSIFYSVIPLLSQECVFYYPKTKDATLEYKFYDKKDKQTSRQVQKIKDIVASDNTLTAEVSIDIYDDKDKLQSSHDIEVSCKDGTYYMDMENYLDGQMLKNMENMEAEIESDNLSYPSNLKVGDKLDDAWIKVKLLSSGFPVMTMEINITEREVVAKENITTPAGTFECFKFKQITEIKTPMKFSIETYEWLSAEVGLVKSETYNKKGEKNSYSELVSISK